MLIRRVSDHDYPDLLQPQEANLFVNLPTVQHKEGFLSARFAAEDRCASIAPGADVACCAD
jgi:hypothetical protein